MLDAARIEYRWYAEESRWLKLSENPLYRSYPVEMCQWRSLTRCARVRAADIVGGLYLPEEVESGPVTTDRAAVAEAAAPPSPEEFKVGEKPEPPANEPETKTEPTSPAPAETTQEPNFDMLIAEVVGKLGGDPKACHRLIGRYFSAFLGVKTLPKDRAKLLPPLQKLVAVIADKVADLKADPEALGNLLAGRAKSKLEQAMDLLAWPAPIRDLARKVLTALGQTEDQFALWIQQSMVGDPGGTTAPVSIASMPAEALELFLPMFLLVRGRAWEPIEFAVARGQGITETLQAIVTASGKPLNEWDADWAKAILDEVQRVAKGPEPAKTAAPVPPAPEEY
jgi:hypothetical protein